MDAGSVSSSVYTQKRRPAYHRDPALDVFSMPFLPSMRASSRNPSSRYTGDRFIPNRSAMNMDVANYLLTESRKEKEKATVPAHPSKLAYRKLLAENLLQNRSRIFTFNRKPPTPARPFFDEADNLSSLRSAKPAKKQQRHISQSAERTLDAPDIIDDFYLPSVG